MAFDSYKKKHHLEDYKFFVGKYGYGGYEKKTLYALKPPNDDINTSYYDEILSPHTLIKYIKMVQDDTMKIALEVPGYRLYTLDELKENILIERLAGLL